MPQRTIDEIRAEVRKKPLERSMTIARDAAVDEEARTVQLAFASDKPCETWFGELITTVSKKAIRTDRLDTGLALLLDHDRTKQIGIVEEYAFGNDGIARATVRFSDGVTGEEIFRDVKNGIRRSVSVGFIMHEMHLESQKDDEPDVYRSDDWEPLEISIVSIPADIAVGVGKSFERISIPNPPDEQRADLTSTGANTMTDEEKKAQEAANRAAAPAPVVDPPATRQADLLVMDELREYGEALKATDVTETYIRESVADNGTFTGTKAGLFARIKANQPPSTQVPAASVESVARGFSPGRVNDRLDVVSIGEAFIRSAVYKDTVGKSRRRGMSVAVEVPMMPNVLQRATFDSSSTGLQGYINYAAGPILVEQQRLTVRDLLSVGQTNMPSVPYIKETSYTNAATTVAEEGEKPEATFALQDEFAPVRKIAVIAKVTDEMWNDFPTLRDYINSRLRFMVQEREEAQLLSGAGTGSEITGILTESIQSQALGADTHADAVHKGITKIRAVGKFEPDGAVFHPDDWQQMRLAKDDNNQYYGGGPFSGPYGNGVFSNAERYWGLPVVVTTAISSGTGLVGAFKLGAQIWDREGITVDATNSDEDDFRYNRMAIRVEERLALAIYRPLAFCKITGI